MELEAVEATVTGGVADGSAADVTAAEEVDRVGALKGEENLTGVVLSAADDAALLLAAVVEAAGAAMAEMAWSALGWLHSRHLLGKKEWAVKASHALLLFTLVDVAACCTTGDGVDVDVSTAAADEADGVGRMEDEVVAAEEDEVAGFERVAEEDREVVATGLIAPLPLLTMLLAATGLLITGAAVRGVEAGAGLAVTSGFDVDGVVEDVGAEAVRLVCIAFLIPHSRHTSGLNACAT